MGSIKINTETTVSETNSIDNQNFFVDRQSQSEVFEKNLLDVTGSNNQLIYYAGTGGIGKSTLIQKLENDINNATRSLRFKTVSYDFTSGTDMLTALNALKKFLADNYGVEFQFFEEGCLSYYTKCGDEAGKIQIEKILQESTFLNKHKKNLANFINQSYNISNLNKVLGGGLGEVGYIAEGIPMFRMLQGVVGFIDDRITALEKIRRENDKIYRNFAVKLEEREKHISPEAIKEYLPTLLAMDISKWLEKENFFLVVFLDTYEQLTEDEKDTKRHEKLICEKRDVPADWWIENLICNTARVLWVIAGRSKVEKIGEHITLKENEHIFTLTALGKKFADEFLSKAGIKNSNLREGIIKLTCGYPVYLAACVDTYNVALASKGELPALSDFGEKRADIIERLLGFMNDGTRKMVKRLCVLGRWTDVLAMRVLGILNKNNRDTYERVKKLSFVSAQSDNVFAFDRSIQGILFKDLLEKDKFFIWQTRDAVNQFFQPAFYEVDAEENADFTNEDRILFFKFWSDIILRTTGAQFLMKQYSENLAPISAHLDDNIVKEVVVQFKNKIEKNVGKENIHYAFFDHLLAQIKFAEGDSTETLKFAENAYKKISNAFNVRILKSSMSEGHYSMALFYAMRLPETADNYKTFTKNFKIAVKNMSADAKKIFIAHYGRMLRCFLDVYRKCDEAIALIDRTIEFIGDGKWLGESFNEFLADIMLYKLSAINHLGKVEEFQKIAKDCLPLIKGTGNFEQYIVYNNDMVVHLQDIFNYAESLKIGNEVLASCDCNETNFSSYKYQYFCLCGSVVLTCYFTLNKSQANLKLARKLSDIAIAGFTRTADKIRQYQLRAQIEAEVGNFETACEMLNKGINISIENPQAAQFKNFIRWDWYHFSKFVERLLKTADEKYFDIARHAVEVAKEEFLHYRNKIGDTPKHPDYITFSKMATCFEILGDAEISMQLHEDALRGVDTEINGAVSANANGAALRLVMLANFLRTAEKSHNTDKAELLRQKIKISLDEYLNTVSVDSMKAPFADWQEDLSDVEKMCRAILL